MDALEKERQMILLQDRLLGIAATNTCRNTYVEEVEVRARLNLEQKDVLRQIAELQSQS